MSDSPRYFATAKAFGAWLAKHHGKADELIVGFWKKDTGKPCMTWPQSVDEALCVGWIDGVRRSLGAESYTIRFTPRRAGSTWSAVNVKRIAVLREEGRLLPAGEKAFSARSDRNTGIYSHEQAAMAMPAKYVAVIRKDKGAWAFYKVQAPSYQRAATWWVVSAKKDETRARRLAALVKHSAAGERIPQFTWKKKEAP